MRSAGRIGVEDKLKKPRSMELQGKQWKRSATDRSVALASAPAPILRVLIKWSIKQTASVCCCYPALVGKQLWEVMHWTR